ncbi:unnamed protein product [[Candida] boidinii]|nr:hypothetical protein BVG19_g2645 [[Candida] boidinii]OWB48668.1 hypothetical protein B5S27_g203 [[Candida] boidinii]OWB83172.1 hypothetical protein B5S33_g1801 [[Candida] boidinii]GME87371.1 unnamed protein product [[Candida] boidinii]
MGWWPFSSSKSHDSSTDSLGVTDNTDTSSSTSKKPVFLEDIPPKFEDKSQRQLQNAQNQQQQQQQPGMGQQIKEAFNTISVDDFKFESISKIPCFREAGLSGFSAMFVFGTVMLFYHKDFRRAANWGFGGLMLGSIFGWEQCNNTRRNGLKNVQLAQEKFQQKQMEKYMKEREEIENSKK